MTILKDYLVIPAPSARDLAVEAAEPILADGDYRFIAWQPPLVVKGVKNFTTGAVEDLHTVTLDLKLSPLRDPQDATTVVKQLSVRVKLVCPVSLDPAKEVDAKKVARTAQFFQALYGDSFGFLPKFANTKKGETEAQYKAKRAEMITKVYNEWMKIYPGNAEASYSHVVVDGRVRAYTPPGGKPSPQASFYSEDYLKNPKLKPAWHYSTPRGV